MEQTKDQFNKLKVGDKINVEYICHGNKTKYLVRVVKLINDSFAGSAIEIIPKIPFDSNIPHYYLTLYGKLISIYSIK